MSGFDIRRLVSHFDDVVRYETASGERWRRAVVGLALDIEQGAANPTWPAAISFATRLSARSRPIAAST
jgi:hypothetical protein